MNSHARKENKLFQPLAIANGRIQLKHRIVYTPLIRLRGLPIIDRQDDNAACTAYYPDILHAEYYGQRANESGLLISEGIPPSMQGTGLPFAPRFFLSEQVSGWKKVTDAVHAKKGYVYAQLWHSGRVAIPHYAGEQPVSSSSEPRGTDELYPIPTPEGTMVKYKDHPPQRLDWQGIQRVIGEFVQAARNAMKAGFDGIEVHPANGHLPEQFLASNINTRNDEYGGSPEKRPKFVMDLLAALSAAIGSHSIGIRLSPFGLFNQMRSTQKIETWSALCRGMMERPDIGPLSYVHFIEPRFEQLRGLEDKEGFFASLGPSSEIALAQFRKIHCDTPIISAGGWNPNNCWDAVQDGTVDGLAFGRLFLANPGSVDRLREGKELNMYNRSLFYSYTAREEGYIDCPAYDEVKKGGTIKWWDGVPDQIDSL